MPDKRNLSVESSELCDFDGDCLVVSLEESICMEVTSSIVGQEVACILASFNLLMVVTNISPVIPKSCLTILCHSGQSFGYIVLSCVSLLGKEAVEETRWIVCVFQVWL